MSRLINQNWIGLNGEPVTGRVPPQLIMMEGVLTPRQYAQVTHAYQMFCMGKLTSTTDYFVADRRLTDGTRVRCESMQGRDRVLVWSVAPKGSPEIQPLNFQFQWAKLRGTAAETDAFYSWRRCERRSPPATYTGFPETEYPGNFTWSSKKIRVKGRMVQLSWGVPRAYSYDPESTTGLWVDGAKVRRFNPAGMEVSTSKAFMAACIVRKKIGGVDRFLLRVLEVTFEAGDAISIDFVDYGEYPAGTPFATLTSLTSGGRMTEVERTAGPTGWTRRSGGPNTADLWTPVTRMCFSESGGRVAFVAKFAELPDTDEGSVAGLTQGVAIADIDIEEGTLTRVYAGRTYAEGTVITAYTYDEATGTPGGGTSTAGTSIVRTPMAADYLGEELVWVWKEYARTGNDGFTVYDNDGTGFVRNTEWVVSAGHSKHGKLVEFTHSMSVTVDGFRSAGGSGSASRVGGTKYLDVAFGGNLARDGFVLGWCEEELAPAPTLTYSGYSGGYVSFAGEDVTIAPEQLRFNAYMGGRRVAQGLLGPRVFGRVDPPWTPSTGFTITEDEVTYANAGTRSIMVPHPYGAPGDNETISRYFDSQLGLAGGLVTSGDVTLWGVGRVFFYDFSYGLMDPNGVFICSPTPVIQCVVSAGGKAMYAMAPEYGADIVQPTRAGLCHFVRTTENVARVFQLAYTGIDPTNPDPPYLLVPHLGIFYQRDPPPELPP